MRRIAAIAVVLLLALTACSQADGDPTIAVGDDTVILDVRSPSEFAAGHLEGAELLDFNAGEFEDALPGLDPEAEYVVYCRSGNRSGQAVALMEKAGFANVTDLGSIENASSATGIGIVK